MEETPVKSGFGKALRAAREASGFSLHEVGNITKIQVRYIEALEEENWAKVPSGIIGRGFVRLVAKETGGDVKKLVEMYQAARGEEPPSKMRPQADTEISLGPKELRPVIRYAIGGAVVLLGGLILLWAWAPWQDQVQPAKGVAAEAGEEVALMHTLGIKALAKTWVIVRAEGVDPEKKVLEPASELEFNVAVVEVEVADAGAVRLIWDGEALKEAGEAGDSATVRLPEELDALKP